MWCQLMCRIFVPANFCDYFLISPTTAPEGKYQFLLLQAKSEGKSTGLWSFVNQQQHQFGRGKKRIWTASCLVQIKLPEPLLERGRREGRREEEKSLLTNFATVIQIQALDKHIHPIMLRLFVTIATFFLLFIQQLEKLHQFKFNLRVFFVFKII